MAGSLGDLIVRVGASIENFESAMGTASQRLTAVDNQAAKAGVGLSGSGPRSPGMGTALT